jgi:thermitase
LRLSVASLAAFTLLLVPSPAHGAAVDEDTVLVRPAGKAGTRALAGSSDVAGTIARLPQGARLVRVVGDPRAVAARLARRPGIRWAEPNVLLRATAAPRPNDPLFGEQRDLARIGAADGWAALGLGAFPIGGGTSIGIVDTGIDARHEDLAGRVAGCATASDGTVVQGRCADDDGHGTHVAGTIGAKTQNGRGIAGIAFDSPLIVCRALTDHGAGTAADVAACVAWLHEQGARVISLSLGGPGSRTLAAAVAQVYARGGRSGSLVVAAAGNEGDGLVDFPAGLAQAVSVAATDDRDAHAAFSNVNADVEIAAPGVDVLSAKLGGGYLRESGTSMATPHVAAAAALLWGAEPSASASTIRGRLDRAVVDLGPPGRDREFGFGRLDLSRLGR